MSKYKSISPEEIISYCRSCGCKDLYLQKDFPRKIALVIVGLGVLASPWTLGFSLIGVALIDYIIFQLVPWMSVCYGCRAEYRGFCPNPAHQEFDRHKDELYKFG